MIFIFFDLTFLTYVFPWVHLDINMSFVNDILLHCYLCSPRGGTVMAKEWHSQAALAEAWVYSMRLTLLLLLLVSPQVCEVKMLPYCSLLLWLCVVQLLSPSSALPFEQRGFWDFAMDSMDAGGMMTMMRDEEEGSAVEEIFPPDIHMCPFGCHCQPRVVQCSDLGQWEGVKQQRVTERRMSVVLCHHFCVCQEVQKGDRSNDMMSERDPSKPRITITACP